MSVQRVHFSVTKTVNASAGLVPAVSEKMELVDLPTPASGITYDWIVQSINNAFPEHRVQVVELKYEDDEHDLITFSSEHEVLEAITVADAAQQEVFRVFATVITEPRVAPAASTATGAEEKDEASAGGFRGILAQIGLYLTTLSDSARESIADAVQVGIQQLKELGDPKQALLDTLAMFPESPSFDLNKIVADVKKVSAEQWEQAKEFIKRIPEQTWAFIEASVPQLVNFLKSFGRGADGASPFAGNPLAALMGGFGGAAAPAQTNAATGSTGAAPAAAANPFGAFAQFAPLLGMMSMMGGRRNEEKQDFQLPVGVQVEITSVDEMIPVAEPGMHVVRTWKVKNTGEAPLPEGVQLRAVVDPDNIASEISTVVTLPRLNPGETTEVSQLLQAPQAQGAYNIVYALKTSYGQGPAIGPELPVELLVTEAY